MAMKLILHALLLVVAAGAALEHGQGAGFLTAEEPQHPSLLRGVSSILVAVERDGEMLAHRAGVDIGDMVGKQEHYWIIGGVSLAVVLVVLAVIALVLRGRGAVADTSVALHVTFSVPADKLKDFKGGFTNFFDAICPTAEKMLYYGFTVDESSGAVVCREAYQDAAGVLAHLEHVGGALTQALKIGQLAGLEALGPAAELEKLKEKLAPLGCRFYTLNSSSKMYGARTPGFGSKRAVDTSCLLRQKFKVQQGKVSDFEGLFQEFCGAAAPAQEKLLHYGLGVDEASGSAVITASFADADGVNAHMENVADLMQQVPEVATVESVELHGPGLELDKIGGVLQSLKCQYFVADVNCKTWTWKGGDVATLMNGKEFSSSADIFATTAQKMCEQFQAKMEKGSKAYEIVEEQATGFQEKAKVFLINELNSTAHALLKAIDEEEAQMLLDFNRSVEASFPPVSVLLAGILSPAILSMSQIAHISQLIFLFLPISLGTGFAAYEDWGATCDIPGMTAWTWFAFGVTTLLVFAHGFLATTIHTGQASLKEKTKEISTRLAANQSDGETSISDMQEIFIGSTVLVQEALLLEDQIKRSIWRVVIGPCTVLWMLAVIWNFVIVVGWTFVPGQISFYLGTASASAGAFCGSWASVFVARLVCLMAPMFFFVNVAQVIQWAIVTIFNSSTVSDAALSFAQNFDRNNTGIPIVEVLVKAFLLRGSQDVFPARMTVALGEALRLSMECDDLEQQLADVDRQIRSGKSERKALRKAAQNAGEDMVQNLEKLQQAGDEDAGAWKLKGKELASKAEAQARLSREVATSELDKISTYLTGLAEQIKESETFTDALKSVEEAKIAAAQAAVEAQEAARQAAVAGQAAAGAAMAQAQEGIDRSIAYAQSDEAQAALANAQGQAKQMAQQAQDGIDRGIAYAQSDEAQGALSKVQGQAQQMAQQATSQASSAAAATTEHAKQGAAKAKKLMK